MKRLLLFAAVVLTIWGCGEDKNYITQGPSDWQGPEITWQSIPDAEVRGTVGLDVQVTDSSAISRISLYLDGRESVSLTAPPYRFEVVTDSLADGVHFCEARAWDEFGNLGISPILRINVMNSMAEGPHLIWVPDSFATIQAAINASQDYDTIRVRDGTYYETLNLFGKGIWVESENGPVRCRIDAQYSNSVFNMSPNSVFSTIRGFWLTNANAIVRPESGVQCDFFNNIVYSDSSWTLWFSTYYAGAIQNNLFSGSETAVQLGYTWGTFYNNVIQNASGYGQWNAAVYRNPLSYGYNLLWGNTFNYYDFDPGIGDVYAEPMIDLSAGELQIGSPCVNSGNPLIFDLDSTRSDIGPFGGPWAYGNGRD